VILVIIITITSLLVAVKCETQCTKSGEYGPESVATIKTATLVYVVVVMTNDNNDYCH